MHLQACASRTGAGWPWRAEGWRRLRRGGRTAFRSRQQHAAAGGGTAMQLESLSGKCNWIRSNDHVGW